MKKSQQSQTPGRKRKKRARTKPDMSATILVARDAYSKEISCWGRSALCARIKQRDGVKNSTQRQRIGQNLKKKKKKKKTGCDKEKGSKQCRIVPLSVGLSTLSRSRL